MPVQSVRLPIIKPSAPRLGRESGDLVSKISASVDHAYTEGKAYINCYPVQEGHSSSVKQRPGWNSSLSPTLTSGYTALRGLYTWSVDNKVYSCIDNTIYQNGTANGTTILNENSQVYFTSIDTGTRYMFYNSPTEAGIIDSSFTLTKVTDSNYPSATVGRGVSLDGYIFVMDADGFIYNSNVNAPLVWNPEDFINAEYEDDNGVGLAKLGNYIVALGSRTTQVFHNAGVSPGSPLRAVKQANRNIGCFHELTIAGSEDNLFWVGQTGASGNLGVLMMAGLTIQKISPPWLDDYLAEIAYAIDTTGEEVSSLSYTIRHDGRLFYVIQPTSSGVSRPAFAYDTVTKDWSIWMTSYTNPGGGGSTGIEGLRLSQPDQGYSGGAYRALHQGDLVSGSNYDALIWLLDDDVVTDPGNTDTSVVYYRDFTSGVVTDKIDFETSANKFLYRLELVGKQTTTSKTAQIYYTDDDFQSWVDAGTVDTDQNRPTIHAMGRFADRAFYIEIPQGFKLSALDMLVSVGTTVEGTNV